MASLLLSTAPSNKNRCCLDLEVRRTGLSRLNNSKSPSLGRVELGKVAPWQAGSGGHHQSNLHPCHQSSKSPGGVMVFQIGVGKVREALQGGIAEHSLDRSPSFRSKVKCCVTKAGPKEALPDSVMTDKLPSLHTAHSLYTGLHNSLPTCSA